MSKKTLTTFFVGLIIGSVSLSYAAWIGPTQSPPNANTSAPINVGAVAQDKSGVLTLGGLGVFGSALITSSAGYTLPTNLNLGVNGKIGAKMYCDENGQNCVNTLGGGTTVVTSTGKTGSKVVCGGWEVKYPGNLAINVWGCAAPVSNPVCPGGYDKIKTSNPTVNNVEQTFICIISSI